MIFCINLPKQKKQKKTRQMGLYQTQQLLHRKRNNQQSEENIQQNGTKYLQATYPIKNIHIKSAATAKTAAAATTTKHNQSS